MKVGILCGGGPAPGFNGVIESATVAARRRGWTVVGIPHGFSELMRGETGRCQELREDDVSGIATRGGGVLYTSRANPTKEPDAMAAVVDSVRSLGLDALITVGGDDTATSAAAVARAAGGLRVAHVPKTIDNDLPLPGGAPTFGFETARLLGAQLCRNLREDARTTGRWYLVTAMGRSAGHLTLGMAMGSEADLAIIREEFAEERPIRLGDVAQLVVDAIEERRSEGQMWGLVVLAEGILERLDPAELKAAVGNLELDEHGNPRMSEVDLGRVVRDVAAQRLQDSGHKVGFITKIIGYELRCADPCAFDVHYTRSLGAGAIEFLASGTGDAIVSIQDGRLVPLALDALRDPKTGRIPVRRVDTEGFLWQASLALQARKLPTPGPSKAAAAKAVA